MKTATEEYIKEIKTTGKATIIVGATIIAISVIIAIVTYLFCAVHEITVLVNILAFAMVLYGLFFITQGFAIRKRIYFIFPELKQPK